MTDEEIVEQIIEENQEGLKRLADEEPSEEKRSKLKRLKSRIFDFFGSDEKVGHVSA